MVFDQTSADTLATVAGLKHEWKRQNMYSRMGLSQVLELEALHWYAR
jgi:hypothetical protein